MKDRANQILALTVGCRYCNAKKFEPCHNKETGTELRHFAAHQRRITDAKTHPAEPEDDEVPF